MITLILLSHATLNEEGRDDECHQRSRKLQDLPDQFSVNLHHFLFYESLILMLGTSPAFSSLILLGLIVVARITRGGSAVALAVAALTAARPTALLALRTC